MRLGKRERAARKIDAHAKLAQQARIVSVVQSEGKYATAWQMGTMKIRGRKTVAWEYWGRNATRIKQRKDVQLGVRGA